MLATKPAAGSRARVARRRPAGGGAGRVVTVALALAAFTIVCTGIYLQGCMKLDAATARRAALQADITGIERANFRLAGQRDALIHPDRLAKIAEGAGMRPVEPSAVVQCPPPPRMAKAADTFSGR